MRLGSAPPGGEQDVRQRTDLPWRPAQLALLTASREVAVALAKLALTALAATAPLDAGALAQTPPTATEARSYRGLHSAAFRGDAAVVGALLAGKADPNLLDGQRYDAVTIAAVRDDVDTLRALLAHGASAGLTTSPYDGTALIAA